MNTLLERITWLILIFLPLYLVRVSILGASTNMLELLIIAGVAGAICYEPRRLFSFIKDTFRTQPLLIVGIVLLVGGTALGVVMSEDIQTSLGALKGWLLLPLLFAWAFRVVGNPNDAPLALLLSGLAVAALSLLFWATGIMTFDNRLQAFFGSPNILAMYLAPAFIFLSIRWVTAPVGHKTVIVSGLLLLGFSLFLTHSLGAYIGIGASLLTLVFYLHPTLWKKVWIIWVICVVLAGILGPLGSFFFNPWDMGRTSVASRLMIWQASWSILEEHWLFGIGPGTFQKHYLLEQEQFPPYLEWAVPHPHNIWLATWLYAGIAGLIGLGLILWSFFTQQQKETQLVSLLILMYIMVHGAIDNTLWRNEMMIIFFLFLSFKEEDNNAY